MSKESVQISHVNAEFASNASLYSSASFFSTAIYPNLLDTARYAYEYFCTMCNIFGYAAAIAGESKTPFSMSSNGKYHTSYINFYVRMTDIKRVPPITSNGSFGNLIDLSHIANEPWLADTNARCFCVNYSEVSPLQLCWDIWRSSYKLNCAESNNSSIWISWNRRDQSISGGKLKEENGEFYTQITIDIGTFQSSVLLPFWNELNI